MSTVQLNHAQALRSGPPGVLTDPLCYELPINSTSVNSTATTSNGRIIPVVLTITGYLDPITTILGSEQLAELFPTVHMYLDPLRLNVAVLPALSVTYNGLTQALRWREAGNSQYQNMQTSLAECIEVYQALYFLGNKPDSQRLKLLEEMIQTEIEQGLSLKDVQSTWSLRGYSYTGRFVNSMLKKLVTDHEMMEEDTTTFLGRTSADAELDDLLVETAAIFKWISGEKELHERFKYVQAGTEDEKARVKRDRRMAIVMGKCSPSSNVPMVINQARQACRVRPQLVTISK